MDFFEKHFNKLFKDEKGFSLIEVIVVMAIFSLALVGISSLMLQTMQAESLNAGYLKASMLAQEGLELVRGYRDENWLNPALPEWDAGFNGVDTDKTFTVYYGNTININDIPDNLNNDLTILRYNGTFYDHVASGIPSIYRRLITVDNASCGTNCWNIKSEVQWTASGKINNYVVQTNLYDWR